MSPNLLNRVTKIKEIDSVRPFSNLKEVNNSKDHSNKKQNKKIPIKKEQKQIETQSNQFQVEYLKLSSNSSGTIGINSPMTDPELSNISSKIKVSKKQNKGLKLLSVVVKDIVIAKRWTTYKEVAEIILNDSVNLYQAFLTKPKLAQITKEEQNIKRRVYDALNVLISAGVLVKEGKRVCKNKSNKIITLSELQYKTSYFKTLLNEKINRVVEIREQISAFKNLLRRNKENHSHKYLGFPFLLFRPVKLTDDNFNVKIHPNLRSLQITSSERIKIIPDLQALPLFSIF